MAYSINPNLPKARAVAMRLLVVDELPISVVAYKCGVHRTTIWRWKRKWDAINCNWQQDNPNRPNRQYSKKNHLARCSWNIPTLQSTPNSHPWTIPKDIVQAILSARQRLKRCAEVVWHYVTTVLGLCVSLSSVRRILRRHHCFDGARKPRVKRENPRRPLVTAPGELVQTDTIHYICPNTGRRRYVYTVIDLYTRMAYARMFSRILPGLAAKTVLEAREYFGFPFQIVQADNGLEFSRYFSQVLTKEGITVRHSRLGRPNDNAHIERFNRTIQEECLGSKIGSNMTTDTIQAKLEAYTRFYNEERIHLGIQLRTPSQMLQRF